MQRATTTVALRSDKKGRYVQSMVVVDASSSVFGRCRRRDGRDAGWSLDQKRDTWGARRVGHHRSRPLIAPSTSRARRRCSREQRISTHTILGTMLTGDRFRAGRNPFQVGDGRINHNGRLEVPRQLEAGQRQDVRAWLLNLLAHWQLPHSPGSHIKRLPLTTCSGRPIAVHFLSLPDRVCSHSVLRIDQPPLTLARRLKYPTTTNSRNCLLL